MTVAYLNFLTEDEVQMIHSAELKMLETIGIKIEHDDALNLLDESGADINRETQVAKIPNDLVTKCLQKCPQKVTLGWRDEKEDKIIGPEQKQPLTRTAGGQDIYIDPVSGKARNGTVEDMKNFIKMQDALDYDFCSSVYPDPNEVLLSIRDVKIAQIVFENCRKHFVIGPYGEASLKYMIDMALKIRGSKEALTERPIFSILIASISPLQIPHNQVSMILEGSKYGIPLMLMPMPIAGATAPATIAGVSAMAGAEALAMNTIAQLSRPHTPVIYTPRAGSLDMNKGVMAMGIGWAMIQSVLVQVAKEKYNIPVDVLSSTNSVIPDAQSMIESVLTSICPGLAGANIIGGAGNLDTGLAADPVQLVIDNDINGMVSRAIKGVNVTDKSIGLDVMSEVGIGGEFLTHAHTLEYFKDEFYRSCFFNLESREGWEAAGSKDLKEKAREKAIEIIKEYRPKPLDEKISKELKAIVSKAKKEIL